MIKLRDGNGNVLGTIQDSGEMTFTDKIEEQKFNDAENAVREQQARVNG